MLYRDEGYAFLRDDWAPRGGYGEGFAAVRASHANHPGWRHRRTLVHLRPHRLVIVDDVAPTGRRAGVVEHTFDQLHHLAPHLDAAADPAQPGVVVARDGSGAAKLRIGGDELAVVLRDRP